ncbi:MAG: leucine-rich repeat protein [Lachnospiraceae bacterium]|nr:leucine-rich repeat protein [Lachnospiraceae bacterium]
MKKRKRMKKRFAALAMAVILAWTTVDMPIVAAGSQDVSCEHHVEHTAECGYAEGEDGLEISPCNFECEECTNASNDGSDTVSGNEMSDETTECTCGTDDPAFHATNCPAYIAPENPQCFCAEKCTDDTLNVWCDVCGVQGVSACQGDFDSATSFASTTTVFSNKACGASTNEGGAESVTCTFVWDFTDTNNKFGILTISGSGAMADSTPYWARSGYDYRTPEGNERGRTINKVIVEEGITYIGDFAFYGCTYLDSVLLPSSLKSIGDLAFADCPFETIDIPSGVTSIGQSAFNGCSNLTSITIPEGVKYIERQAFQACSSLTSVTIPDGVIQIGMFAFVDCTGLQTVSIPSSIQNIGNDAFKGCTSLTTVNVPCSWENNPLYTFEEGVTVNIADHNRNANGACIVCKDGYATEPNKVSSTHYPELNDTHSGYYAIETMEQLCWFSDYVNKGNTSVNAVLTDDIVAGANDIWTPIGNNTNIYAGTFDGNNHTISGLYTNNEQASYVGLFGTISGTVKNVGVTNVSFSGTYSVGGVCGENRSGTIQNCYSTGSISNDDQNAGGVCGFNGGTIQNCYSECTVEGASFVGGVCGYNNGTIQNCYSTGSISNVDQNAGGVCGINNNSITNCYYLNGTYWTGIGGDGQGTAESKTENEFNSGAVAYLLNNSTSTGNLVWYQNLSDNTDSYPVLNHTHGTVYSVYKCDGTTIYRNVNENMSHIPNYSASGDTITASCSQCSQENIGTIVISASNKYYDGTAVTATVENNVDGTYYSSSIVYKDNTGTKVDGAVNVGIYTANLTLTSANGTEVTASCQFNITKAEITSITDFGVVAPVAGETPQSSVAAGTGYTAEISWQPDDTSYAPNTVYIATVTLTADTNHSFADSITVSGWDKSVDADKLVFTKEFDATGKLECDVIVPTANILTYNGSAQELVTAGTVPDGCEMQYKLGDDGTFSDEIPTATDANTYKVYWKVVGNDTYNDIDNGDYVEVTISKATPTSDMFTATPSSELVYDGTEKSIIVTTDKEGMGTFTVSYVSFTDSTQPVEAGYYIVRLHIEEGDNYIAVDTLSFVPFEIKKADSVITAAPTPIAELVYDGTAHNLINEGTATGGTMQYSLDGTNYSSAIPTGTDAKTYTVWYKVVGDENHNDTTPASIEVTIAPKTVEISSVTAINRAFDGTNTVEISEVIIEGILDEDEDKVSVSATAAIDSINAGEYIIVDLSNITLTGSANYSIAASTENVPLTTAVTISKADAPTLPSGSKAYVYSIGYEGESVSITGLPTNCGEVEYSLLSVSSDMFENLSVDSRSGKITYDVKALDNYTEDLQGTISVNVMMENYKTAIYTLTITRTEKIPQNISAEDITLTYGDADATISVTGAKTELSYEVVEDSNDNGYVVTVDANGKVSIENAGTAIIKITAVESDDYAESECEIRVTVNKRPVNVPAKDSTVYTYTGKEQTYSIASSPYYTIANATHTDAGKYEVVVNLNENCVWNGNLPTYEFEIKPATVNIKAESYTVKKGDTLPTFYYDVTGLVNNETLPITVSIACTASDTNTVGTYDITVSGVSSEGNYTYVYTNGVLEVLAEDEAPFIMGDDGKMGWDAISDEIEDANKGDTIVVDMNGATVVPGDIIEEARDKGITISFVLDNGLTWTIDGSTVTDGDISNINFDTTVEDENNPLNNIPVDVINGVTGEKATIEVNLTYSGNFGFTAVLKANLGSDNAGYYANLYYYNPTTGKLEYMCADVIASNGEAELSFTHASDYLIVIDDEDLGKAPDDDADDDDGDDNDDDDDNTTEDKDDGKDEVPDTGDDGTLYLWVLMLCALIGMAGVTYYEKLLGKKE